jgi:hypothetical protein
MRNGKKAGLPAFAGASAVARGFGETSRRGKPGQSADAFHLSFLARQSLGGGGCIYHSSYAPAPVKAGQSWSKQNHRWSSADFQVCRVAGFQDRAHNDVVRPADLEIGDTAGWETCATKVRIHQKTSKIVPSAFA